LSPGVLEQILEGLPRATDDPRVLVAFDEADDAAVYQIDADRALLMTVDVITPIVDDAWSYGAIAATNAISDIFAMGGMPLMALNVACFHPDLPVQIYRDILGGAAEAASKLGCPILGGHTIKDHEIKFGLAVVGEVRPDEILRNSGAQPGDRLLLTKALGTATLATALKRGTLSEDDAAYRELVDNMLLAPAVAAKIAREFGAHAMTDVTGFGLSGHGLEMATASNMTLRIDSSSLPRLPRVDEFLRNGIKCAGADANSERAENAIRWESGVDEASRGLLHDPQTSGPLLIALPAEKADQAAQSLRDAGYVHTRIIGEVLPPTGNPLEVL
jgi:selenide,water dikinase